MAKEREISYCLADSELGRMGVFKSQRLYNSTLLTADCPETQTHTFREHKNSLECLLHQRGMHLRRVWYSLICYIKR